MELISAKTMKAAPIPARPAFCAELSASSTDADATSFPLRRPRPRRGGLDPRAPGARQRMSREGRPSWSAVAEAFDGEEPEAFDCDDAPTRRASRAAA